LRGTSEQEQFARNLGSREGLLLVRRTQLLALWSASAVEPRFRL